MTEDIVEITCYVPTKTKSGQRINPTEVNNIINEIWPKYRGATVFKAKGFYRQTQNSSNEKAKTRVMSIVTEHTESMQDELENLKQKIKEKLDQNEVLITWQHINLV